MLLGLLSLSATAFGQTCRVDMIDSFGRTIQTFRAYGDIDSCIEGMKECRKTIRFGSNPRGVDCVRVGGGNTIPVPPTFPPTNPNPNPFPPTYGRDNNRMVTPNESVIYNNSYYKVIGTSFNGTLAIKSDWSGNITQGIRREEIAVTNGCGLTSCTGKSVINLSSVSYSTVVGLRFNEGYVIKSDWSGNLTAVNENGIAATSGCTSAGWNQICVGNQVLTQNNSYASVVGIQNDGRVVIKSDWSGNLTAHVDPRNLIITR